GVGDQHDVPGVDDGEGEVGDAVLAPQQRQHLGVGIERDAETPPVPAGHRRAELGEPAVRGIAEVARVVQCRDRPGDDLRRGGQVGVADVEPDHVDPLATEPRDPGAHLREEVGRDPPKPGGGAAPGRTHRPLAGRTMPWTGGGRVRFSDLPTPGTWPLNTVTAGPVISTGDPGSQAIVSTPPRSSTSSGWSASPSAASATAVAQAPVPQASVSPTPRSRVRCRTRLLVTSCTNSTFAPEGKRG